MATNSKKAKEATEEEVLAAIQKALESSRFAKLEAAERGLRATPVADRSRATFDAIIDTAAQVLDDVPLRDITTHLIADRAEVNIATLYRYFADLEAVLVEFDLRYQRASLTGIAVMAARGAFTDDRRQWIEEMIDLATIVRTDTPGAIGIARDGYAVPQVREITRAAEEAAASMVAVGLGYYAPGRPREEWEAAALTVIRSVSRCLDEACATRPADLEQVELLKDLTERFFEPYFE